MQPLFLLSAFATSQSSCCLPKLHCFLVISFCYIVFGVISIYLIVFLLSPLITLFSYYIPLLHCALVTSLEYIVFNYIPLLHCSLVTSLKYIVFLLSPLIIESVSEDNHFFIISPKDVVVAKPRDQDDHVTWLLEHDKNKTKNYEVSVTYELVINF